MSIRAKVGLSVAFLAVLLSGLYVLAAPGDAQYYKWQAARTQINAGQKVMATNGALATFPGIAVAHLDWIDCRESPVTGKIICHGEDNTTYTAAEELDLALDGVDISDPNITTGYDNEDVNAAGIYYWDLYTDSVCGASFPAEVKFFKLWRSQPGIFQSRCATAVTDTPDNWRADRLDTCTDEDAVNGRACENVGSGSGGYVYRLISKVE